MTTKQSTPQQQIANFVVRVIREQTGRGPTHAKCYLHEELVTVVMTDVMTPAEKTLAMDGRRDWVLQTRVIFQETMATTLCDGVGEILGRQVIAFLSANHIQPDISVETFILAK